MWGTVISVLILACFVLGVLGWYVERFAAGVSGEEG